MKRKNILLFAIPALFIGGLLFGGLFDRWHCNYRNVSTPDGRPYHHLEAWRPPLYVVKDGNLYLLKDKRKHPSAIFFTVIVIPQIWTVEKVDELVTNQPDLKRLLPDLENETRGIKWINNEKR